MRIKARQDVEAPIAQVFEAATDHEAFERQALRRGADVRRLDPPGGAVPGSAWRVAFPFRGREREATLRLDRIEAPVLVSGTAEGGGLAAQTTADFLALSRTATRLTLVVEIRPQGFAARLMLQGLRLARGSIERRLEERLAAWAREVEARARRVGARA